ncbi:unnamed protein product [Meganyctiphanes norvegica]|uniref:Uncharacterized protein n=1 Tax=Meganyctiphanes norvegica TaxID=48144 RepID=A0AAV2PPC5_MEGNR
MRWRSLATAVVSIAGITTIIVPSYIFYFSYPFADIRPVAPDPVPRHRELAQEILRIQQEIHRHAGSTPGSVEAGWALQLWEVARALDARLDQYQPPLSLKPLLTENEAQKGNNKGESVIKDEKEVVLNEDRTKLLCPEVYLGRRHDKTQFHNYETTNCTYGKPLSDIVSILLPAASWDFKRVKFVVEKIRETYHIPIYIISWDKKLLSLAENSMVFVDIYSNDIAESVALNNIVSKIQTPQTLVLHSVDHFSKLDSPIERLVRVLDDNEAISVAAGAYRDQQGYWSHGCLQAVMNNYRLVYTQGYEHSKVGCMFCDDALGPFLTWTQILKDVPFTTSLDGASMYRDWYLNLQNNRGLSVVCPDVMFFLKSSPKLVKHNWLQIATIWSLQTIKTHDHEIFDFSCDDVGIICKNLIKSVSSFLLPPCCLEKALQEFEYLQTCAEELGLAFGVQAGTQLGFVKLGRILPWDFDTDGIYLCNEQPIWEAEGWKCMKRKGCSVHKQSSSGYFTSHCSVTVIDFGCRSNITFTGNLPKEVQSINTRQVVGGRTWTVMGNPGLFCRNYYGQEYLKHAIHWRYETSSKSVDSGNQVVGSFKPCKMPGHHACLDKFPGDGSLKFIQDDEN